MRDQRRDGKDEQSTNAGYQLLSFTVAGNTVALDDLARVGPSMPSIVTTEPSMRCPRLARREV